MTDTYDTWEPVANIYADSSIERFWKHTEKHTDVTIETLEPGYEIEADDEFIGE
jgi:hypothetical protein